MIIIIDSCRTQPPSSLTMNNERQKLTSSNNVVEMDRLQKTLEP
jgi:hypothetical protein